MHWYEFLRIEKFIYFLIAEQELYFYGTGPLAALLNIQPFTFQNLSVDLWSNFKKSNEQIVKIKCGGSSVYILTCLYIFLCGKTHFYKHLEMFIQWE